MRARSPTFPRIACPGRCCWCRAAPTTGSARPRRPPSRRRHSAPASHSSIGRCRAPATTSPTGRTGSSCTARASVSLRAGSADRTAGSISTNLATTCFEAGTIGRGSALAAELHRFWPEFIADGRHCGDVDGGCRHGTFVTYCFKCPQARRMMLI